MALVWNEKGSKRLRHHVKIYEILHLIEPFYLQTVIFIDFINEQEMVEIPFRSHLW